MALIAQSITADGIELVASGGRTFSLTKGEAIALFRLETGGSRTARLQRAIDAIKANIAAALGDDIDISKLVFDFDDVVGMKRLITNSNGIELVA